MNEDKSLQRLEKFFDSPSWKSLSIYQKRGVYYRLCFRIWLEGRKSISWTELFLGAWFSSTKPIEMLWLSLDVEERAVLIAGILIGLLCIVQLISRVGS